MKKVLVVDDEQGYQDMYRFLLEPMGIAITSATNGLEAVEKVKEYSYDLILMDIHMPVMTGSEAVEHIRKLRPDQKVLIFSSSSDSTHTQEDNALEHGAAKCLYKPVELKTLESIIKRMLE